MTIIATKRLLIEPPGEFVLGENIKAVVRWLNDPDVVKYSEQRHFRHTAGTQLDYLNKFPAIGHYREIYYGGKFIGTMAAYVDRENSVADLGILIGDKEYWGKGLGTEAWQAFCDYLINNGIRKIEAGMMGCNFGMVKICRKTHMEEEGRRWSHFLVDFHGQPVATDLIQYARFA